MSQGRRVKRTIKHNASNVAVLQVNAGFKNFASFISLQDTPTVTAEVPILWNLPESLTNEQATPADMDDIAESLMDPSQELLRYHVRLAHTSFRRLQLMAKQGILPRRLAICHVPKCATCLYAKAHRQPWRDRFAPTGTLKGKVSIKKPGDFVSVDQLVSGTPGFVAQTTGILTNLRYKAATVFVDHFSDLSFVYIMKDLSSAETLAAKQNFESFCSTHGVQVKHYHADNGRFADNAFRQHCNDQGQSITLCGVNAHHQNGVAEKRIWDLQDAARAMLVHAHHHWPQAISPTLWPYALLEANLVHRSTPRFADGTSPIEVFSAVPVQPNLKFFHTFGCPMYVLNTNLQSGRRISKWDIRSHIGINLGTSPRHARSVKLILNLTTGHVSPQFHYEADSLFETVQQHNALPPSLWQRLAHLDSIAQVPMTTTPITMQLPASTTNSDRTEFPRELHPAPPTTEATTQHSEQQPVVNTELEPIQDADSAPPITTNNNNTTHEVTEIPPNPPAGMGRGQRQRRPTARMKETEMHLPSLQGNVDQVLNDPEVIALASNLQRSDPDTMYLQEALRAPDRNEFLRAMDEEWQAHCDRGHWEIVDRSTLPPEAQVLPAVWSMKRKRRVDTGEVYKHKARLTVHGGKQEKGINFWETYSPVVSWFSIRFFLLLSMLQGWHTRQLDFVLAYPQADIECDMYMSIPSHFRSRYGPNKVLKLLKNIYGQKQAGRIWYLHLRDKLLSMGYVQSQVDECVFYRQNIILFVYVDDTILASPSCDIVDEAISELKQHFNLTDEGELSDYLGVNISRADDGSLHLSQPRLIESILADLRLDATSKIIATPAMDKLKSCETDDAFDNHFDYRSIIGKLNFLEKSTRPDIAFATHQCARYCSFPQATHGYAVKRIGRYLLGTKDKGIIFKPTNHSFHCWADADFAGMWQDGNSGDHEDDPNMSKSRTGYTITLGSCPLIWASKLQTEIALSTTEAEYIALSQALRETIPLMELARETREHGFDIPILKPKIHCKAFKDNAGALELAKMPKLRPRTKHIATKYHHFREYVSTKRIALMKVTTTDQIADIFTKPLPVELFTKHRLSLLGW
jgi:hypothetical protein